MATKRIFQNIYSVKIDIFSLFKFQSHIYIPYLTFVMMLCIVYIVRKNI